MNLLLDTHAPILFFNGHIQLSEKAKQAIINAQNQKFVSIASIWKFSIKISLKKLIFEGGTSVFLDLLTRQYIFRHQRHKLWPGQENIV